MRGNYLLYALEAILLVLAVTTFILSSQQALQGILLGILVTSALHAAIAGVTVCSGWKKWTMLGLIAPVIITTIVMLIVNLQTDADASATPPTVAVGASYKIALLIVCGILPLANAALVGDGSQWRCTSGLVCTNSTESDALKTSIRKYLNTANDKTLPISGPLAASVNLGNLDNDYLETLKIGYISVNDSGNDVINCLGFKQAIDAQQRSLATQKRQTQIAAKQEDAKISFQGRDAPIIPQFTYEGGGLGGYGAVRKPTGVPQPPPLPGQPVVQPNVPQTKFSQDLNQGISNVQNVAAQKAALQARMAGLSVQSTSTEDVVNPMIQQAQATRLNTFKQ